MAPVIDTILATRIIGIVRLKKHEHPVEIAHALSEGGLPVIEYSLSGTGALDAIAAARAALGGKMYIGAGTILDVPSAHAAMDAGAQFIVTPTLNIQVIAACRDKGVPILCGAFTPTEIITAYQAGADLIKLFPARLGGPQYVRDLLAPLPQVRLVPTGGVTPENARDYLKAGAVAVALGGNLVPEQAVDQGDWSTVTNRARSCIGAVQPIGKEWPL